MIRVSIYYPNDPGKSFDMGYYMKDHIPLAQRLLGPRGLLNIEVDRGISAPDPNDPPPHVAVAHLAFNSVKEVHEAFTEVASELMRDVPNYTDIQPRIQISEVLT